MNILLLSVGTRTKVVQYFKRTFDGIGTVVAADADRLSPAGYAADRFYVIPPVTSPSYMDSVLSICTSEKIDGVCSLIDPEQSVLAKNTDKLKAAGVTVIGSSLPLCALAQNKFRMYRWLSSHGFRCAQSWNSRAAFDDALAAGKVGFPVFVKPVCGSASVGAQVVENGEMLTCLWPEGKNMIVQEFMAGQEIGVDVYADLISGEVVSIFTKKKLRMRAGETDKSVSFRDDALFSLVERFVTEAGFRGPVDIDLFEVGGRYYISEVNPRFGGGYPHAHACGCDFTKLILNNLNGVANELHIGDYEEGVYMMKYSDVTIRREAELVKS